MMKKKKSVQILDHLDLHQGVVVVQARVEVVVGHVVEERVNQMLFTLVEDEKVLTSRKLIEIQVRKGHIQRDFTSFQKRKKGNTIEVGIEVVKIEDDVEDLRAQDRGQDLDEDRDRAIEDAGEDRPRGDLEQEVDHVIDQGHAKRRFQKSQFEVGSILQIQMMINQSKHEKIVS